MSRESYEAVPYPALPFVETHPSTMQTLAAVNGLSAPAIETARVLELGCATGGNIVPMACALPQAKFVGIDYAASQIESAQKFATAVSAKNLELKTMSILDIDRDFGQFDYIIAHGVYSWVPPDVQERVLQICRDNLSENGVAFVSFNAYPGWHILRWIRELMLLHAPNADGANELDRLKRGREALAIVLESPAIKNAPIGAALADAMSVYRHTDAAHLFHELMEQFNEPLQVEQFMARAERFGLQYLADGRINGSLEEQAWPPLKSLLDQAGDDFVRREQHLDFMRNNIFRRTLLVSAKHELDRDPRPDRLAKLLLASSLQPENATPTALADRTIVRFAADQDRELSTNFPLTKVALAKLATQYPHPRQLGELLSESADELRIMSDKRPAIVAHASKELMQAWMMGLIDARLTPTRAADRASERPQVFVVARHQAATGSAKLTNLRHQTVTMNAAVSKVLPQIDGTRTQDQLIEVLTTSGIPRGVAPTALQNLLRELVLHALLFE